MQYDFQASPTLVATHTQPVEPVSVHSLGLSCAHAHIDNTLCLNNFVWKHAESSHIPMHSLPERTLGLASAAPVLHHCCASTTTVRLMRW